MGKEQFELASKKLWDKLLEDKINAMHYMPFSDNYWDQKPKIVICNYENIGYQDNTHTLTFDHFRTWINISPGTVRWTAVFANALNKIITNYPNDDFSPKDMRTPYYDIDELHQSMKNMMYMNLRPTSARGSDQEIINTNKLVKIYKNELKEFILSLSADIFILSSEDSVKLFNNEIFNFKENPLRFHGNKKINNMMVFSIRHPARGFSYKYYTKKAHDIADYIKKGMTNL
jgi:hypothetical protein